MTTASASPAASLPQPSDGADATTPELHDIQKLIIRGYDFHCSRNLVLTVKNAPAAREFLGKLHDQHWLVSAERNRVSDTQGPLPNRCPVSLGFTFEGLRVLGLPERHQAIFKNRARAFAEGAFGRAASQLADTGPNASMFWNPAFRPERAHVLLILHADSPNELDARHKQLTVLAGADAFSSDGWTGPFEGAHLEPEDGKRRHRKVHFDLLDGLSQPAIGARRKSARHLTPAGPHRLGEFVLGYPNDAGLTPWRLTNERPDLSGAPSWRQSALLTGFFRNASFGAFRPMAQDVPAFNRFVEQQAELLNRDTAFIRAKLVGRWENGAVVKPGEEHAQEQGVAQPPPMNTNSQTASGEPNNFDFSDDKHGMGCPFGAHIRRMNPRQDAVLPLNARPLLRRGIPYGPVFQAELKLADASNNAAERGLLGLFFCASLEDQFEHVLGQWANDNPMGPPNRGNAQDPLIGAHNRPGATFDIPQADGTRCALGDFPQFVQAVGALEADQSKQERSRGGFTPFVRTVGTLYAFFPGLSAVKVMATQWGRPAAG